ncbi:hypothetical protein MPSEU_000629000 [Mayamaea pseudoterrestris]|nr:hypothetical protein MPSEU_000629000 [Mayamaea pseudoterrestris]
MQSISSSSSSSSIRTRRKREATATMICLTLATAGVSPISAFHVSSPLTGKRSHRTRHNRSVLSSVPNIAVSLDKPLLTDGGTLVPYERASRFVGGNAIMRWLSSLVSRKSTIQFVAVALVGALLVTLLMKSSAGATMSNSLRTMFGIANGRVQRFVQEREVVPTPAAAAKGVPLTFAEDDNDGFGVCTLLAKRPLGKTNYMQYEFALPRPNDILSLDLGQSLELCCLDENDAVVNGKYYVYQPQATSAPPMGTFSLLVPNAPASTSSSSKRRDASRSSDEEAFARVLSHEIKVGDEVAMRPGPRKLDYRGQYLPVTDMVYICFGTSGIVPVLEQVRAVLPSANSSVQSVTVVWMSEATNDFDVNAELLEQEYFKYSNKMAASCIVENVSKLSSLAESAEIASSVPDFEPGTMAVVSGPKALAKRAKDYLIKDRGYPSDTVCVL